MNILKIKVSNLKTHRLVPTLEVKYLLSEGCWLAGGALRTLVDEDDEICDFDFFFQSAEKQVEAQNKLVDSGFEIVYSCPSGYLHTFKKGSTKIQHICEKFYANPKKIIESFDFTATCAATDGEFIYLTSDFVQDIKKKRLRLSNLMYPVAILKRIVKYANKGYSIKEVAVDFLPESK